MTNLENLIVNDIEARLNSRRDILRNTIRRHLHQSDDPKVMAFVNHLAEVDDWVEADLLNDLDIAQSNLELAELRAIDAALSAIKAGTYGICADCGEPISLERLNAEPIAKRCIVCQEKFEKSHAIAENGSI